ncbi:MAG: hypothetical protein Q9219_007160 [cf. Caloplaca sp. 3 TL-2023]
MDVSWVIQAVEETTLRADSSRIKVEHDYCEQVDRLKSMLAAEGKRSEGLRTDMERMVREKAVLKDESEAMKGSHFFDNIHADSVHTCIADWQVRIPRGWRKDGRCRSGLRL